MGTNDKAFLSPLDAMADSDNVSGLYWGRKWSEEYNKEKCASLTAMYSLRSSSVDMMVVR